MFSSAYLEALRAAMLERLGLTPRSSEEDIDLVNAAFRALGDGGEALRWEPFFFDWFGGRLSEPRALAGPRAQLYASEAFGDFRARLAVYEMERPVRLASPYFARTEPEELLYDEIEALWAAIAEGDDWGPFETKLAAIEAAREGWNLSGAATAR
jgi:uncharacterized protein YdiU (UPF0061 family)